VTTKRLVAAALGALFVAFGVAAQAQQPKVPRIGYVVSGGRNDSSKRMDAFRQGLRDLGYVEGKNIVLEYRYAEGHNERFPGVVAELVKQKVDVLVATALPAMRAAKQATKTIPIVIMTGEDPVAAGLIDSLARPGGNITGVARLTRELNGKRLELLKETIPGISRVGVLWDVTGVALHANFKGYEAAARALKIEIHSLQVQGPIADLNAAFQAANKQRINALVAMGNALLNRYTKRIAELAIQNRLPSMYEASQWAEDGGLMSYAADDVDSFRRAAVYVDKILKGAKPADLPVEQPTKFELVINLKAAKQIGLTIPPNVLARADRVIK
jgi:ABC-type uncharacterized transport system substrate-binding protein